MANIVQAARARIRQAESRDFPVIEAWRMTHFAHMMARGNARGVTGQTDLSTAAWVVHVDANDEPEAAMGLRDDPVNKLRHVTDLYAKPGKAGLRAGMILGRLVEEMSDVDGYEIRGNTDPENGDYLEHLLRRGYEVVSIAFRRVPNGVIEQRRSTERSGPEPDSSQHPAGGTELRELARREPEPDCGRDRSD